MGRRPPGGTRAAGDGRQGWWLYLLACADGSLYTGVTNDLARRLAQHQAGRAARYTRGRRPVRLVHREFCGERGDALRRELEVKRLPRAQKLGMLSASARRGLLAVGLVILALWLTGPGMARAADGGGTGAVAGAAGPSFSLTTVDFPRLLVRARWLTAADPAQAPVVTVRENGQVVEEVAVASSTARHVLLLALDRSSSLETVVGDVKRAAATFVRALPPGLRVAVISFASDIEIDQPFTTDRAELVRAIGRIRAWGGTVLYDASWLAIEMLYDVSDPRDPRTLVLFTDGRDETPVTREPMSVRKLDEVLVLAGKKPLRIITVGMGPLIDTQVLRRLASETHGWHLQAPTAAALVGVYRRLAAQIESERHFNLAFMSPEPTRDGGSRSLVVDWSYAGASGSARFDYLAPPPIRDLAGHSVESTRPPGMTAQPPPDPGDPVGAMAAPPPPVTSPPTTPAWLRTRDDDSPSAVSPSGGASVATAGGTAKPLTRTGTATGNETTGDSDGNGGIGGDGDTGANGDTDSAAGRGSVGGSGANGSPNPPPTGSGGPGTEAVPLDISMPDIPDADQRPPATGPADEPSR